jgi:hypothetical protein
MNGSSNRNGSEARIGGSCWTRSEAILNVDFVTGEAKTVVEDG